MDLVFVDPLANLHHCCAHEKVEPDSFMKDDVNALMSFTHENLKTVPNGHLFYCGLSSGPFLRPLAKHARQLKDGNDSGHEGRGTKASCKMVVFEMGSIALKYTRTMDHKIRPYTSKV